MVPGWRGGARPASVVLSGTSRSDQPRRSAAPHRRHHSLGSHSSRCRGGTAAPRVLATTAARRRHLIAVWAAPPILTFIRPGVVGGGWRGPRRRRVRGLGRARRGEGGSGRRRRRGARSTRRGRMRARVPSPPREVADSASRRGNLTREINSQNLKRRKSQIFGPSIQFKPNGLVLLQPQPECVCG